ncbi:hypothetical protein TSTA_019150 [Talaromyces stipitatus ATCC 10500]|uniref:Uncharacterized protein n=1 Tax=Talaromyces stipitatus (strain ATCC 10500 / CBS 375.48 / QM 6759 / NRRL 1006) TaxID=441959 RepID=B8MH39_TALSN|nr:uncharacterized protein TSTA_019150 [Talaromyces stipitatus ATCC 10500]EED16853.1 hypothetical protein TSTA_019150 [Talaromyces stipitatus ATCC 10500]
MIRPRTVLRLVLYVSHTWLALAILYAGLPSFARIDDGTEYATKLTSPGEESDDGSPVSLSVSAPAGDTDGISLPWFDKADAVMMFHFIHRDEALVKLNVGFEKDKKRLDVWPAGEDRYKKNLLSLTLDNAEKESTTRILTASVPHPPLSLSPSPTYHVRLAILVVLAPLTLLLMGVYVGLISLISTIFRLLFSLFWVFALLFLGRWVYKGRPPVGEFIQEIRNDAKALVKRVRTWRSGQSSNRGKDEEQPPLDNEEVKPDLEFEKADVS